MPYTDNTAAERLIELREGRGLSQEGLATAIKRHARENGWLEVGGIGAIDGVTIRKIEETNRCPSERVRLVIALYFGVAIRDIWHPANRRQVPHGNRGKKRQAVAA